MSNQTEIKGHATLRDEIWARIETYRAHQATLPSGGLQFARVDGAINELDAVLEIIDYHAKKKEGV